MTILSGVEFKKTNSGPWYKWLNKEMLHNSFRYKMGLNSDFRYFDPKYSTTGLYLCRHLKYLINFRKYGPNIGVFDIPDDARVYIDNEEKIRANMITLVKVISSEEDVLEILKKSLEDHTGPVKELCFYGISNSYFKILNWAAEKNFVISLEIMSDYAIKKRKLDSLKWLHEKGLTLKESMSKYAAKSGCIEILEWFREKGISWDSSVTLFASANGHTHVLKWLLDKKCPYNSRECIEASRHFGKWNTKNWILANIKNFTELDEWQDKV